MHIYFDESSIDEQLDIPYQLTRCREELNANNYDAAFFHVQMILSADPEHIKALRIRYKIYYFGKDLDDLALCDLNTIIALRPNDIKALTSRVNFFIYKNKFDGALSDIKKILTSNPYHQSILLSRAKIYEAKEMPDKAITDLNTILQRSNLENKKALLCRARIYFDLGNIEESLVDLNTLLQMHDIPLKVKIPGLLLQIKIFSSKNELDRASASANRLLKTLPMEPLFIEEQTEAINIIAINDPKDAISLLNDLLRRNPNNIDALLQRHQIYKTEGNIKRAVWDEYTAHHLILRRGKDVPSLAKFCTFAIYKHEPFLYASGKIVEQNPFTLPTILAMHGINRVSLAVMQERFNPDLEEEGRNIFDQLDIQQACLRANSCMMDEMDKLRCDIASTKAILNRLAAIDLPPLRPLDVMEQRDLNVQKAVQPIREDHQAKKRMQELTTEELRNCRVQFFSSFKNDSTTKVKRPKLSEDETSTSSTFNHEVGIR